ncbi:MAG: DUF6152 family protein [Steroidobacteraceae bacterium]
MKLWLMLSMVMVAGAAQTHHSFAQFDANKTVVLEGTIKSFEWSNPHAWIWVVVATPNGDETWGVEAQSPNNLARYGWSKRSFQAGDRAKIETHPMRDGSKAGQFIKAILPDGSVLKPVS